MEEEGRNKKRRLRLFKELSRGEVPISNIPVAGNLNELLNIPNPIQDLLPAPTPVTDLLQPIDTGTTTTESAPGSSSSVLTSSAGTSETQGFFSTGLWTGTLGHGTQDLFTNISSHVSNPMNASVSGLNVPQCFQELNYPESSTSSLSTILEGGKVHVGGQQISWDNFVPVSLPDENLETNLDENWNTRESESSPILFEEADYDFPSGQVQPVEDDSRPLYGPNPGANISIRETLCCLLTFAQSEHLTGVGLTRLLQFLHMVLPSNVLPKRMQDINATFSCLNIDEEFEISYYCSGCWETKQSLNDNCTCKVTKKSIHYFISFSIANQLKKLYARPDFLDLIDYKNKRVKHDPNGINDIYDGSIYKEAEALGLDEHSVTFTWNADGVSIYNSSNFELYPFYLSINELPPKQRFLNENIVIGGVWGSKDNPHPNVFLKSIAKELDELKTQGLKVETPKLGEICIKAYLLCGTCDTPAKAMFLNIKSHSGFHSCPKCLIEGEKSDRTEDVLVFPYEDNLPELRDLEYDKHVAQSIALKDPFLGVKGPTLLSYVSLLPMFRSTCIDGMHCAYLGIVKQLLNLWFNSKYWKKPFSLSKKVNEVNELLSKVELPHFVQRVPLGVHQLPLWKASLCRNFLFYMMLPVMKTVMKPVYYEHVTLLVEGITILNGQSTNLNGIAKADTLLNRFAAQFQELYGLRHATHNLHLLRHLATSVSETGPLWATSCFCFEDLNGRLNNLVHGTRHSVKQIARNFPMWRNVRLLVKKLPPGEGKNFCEQLFHKWKRYKENELISHRLFSVGDYDKTPQHADSISESLSVLYPGQAVKFCTFARLFKGDQLFVASSYTRGSRMSCCVKYLSGNNLKYGQIMTFVKATVSDHDDDGMESGTPDFYAVIKCMDVVPLVENSSLTHMQIASFNSDEDVVLVTSLVTVCFLFRVQNVLHLSAPVNFMELE